MNRQPNRRRLRTATWVVVAAWVVFYAVALAVADDRPAPGLAAVQLVVPPLLWVIATRPARRPWLPDLGARTSATDPPGRLLAAATATLPENRREWGRAMTAELAEVRGRSARRRFALSTARATLSLPPAVARSRRPRLPVPTALVTAGVAASVAGTVIFLRREPAAAQYLPPAAAVCLAAALAGCLWFAVAPPRRLGTGRLAPHLGAAAAVVFAAWFLLLVRIDGTEPPAALVPVLGAALVLVPAAAFFLPAYLAGRADRSLRSGLRATAWALAAAVPLSYAIWLPEGVRRHAVDGRSLDGEVVAPVAATIADALVFCLGIFPVLGLTVGLVGAVLGARRAVPGRAA